MRHCIRVVSLCVALTLLLAAAASADTGVVVGLTFEKLGEFPAPSSDELPDDERSIWEKATYVKASGVQFLEDGLYAVAGHADSVNCFGLFTEEGEQLLPYEAALIKRLNARYLSVYYATEETTEKKDALLFIPSDGNRSWFARNTPKDGDLMFKGYARFYDTIEKRFVGDLTKEDFYASSGRLLVFKAGGSTGIYDESGALLSDMSVSSAGHGFLVRNKEIYDEELTLRYTSDTRLQLFRSEGAYLLKLVETGDAGSVIDIDGNIILPGPFKHVFKEANDVFSVQKADGAYALMRADNTEIAASKEQFTLITSGYWYGKDESGYLFVGPDGVMAAGLSNRPESSSLQVYEKQPKGTLVLNTGEWTIPEDRMFGLDYGLACRSSLLKTGGNHCVVYDLFTGQIVLEGDYDDTPIRVGRFVVAQRGDVCELYRIRYEYE